MASDYEDLYDIEDMDDEELHDLIVQKLSEIPEVDAEALEVEVEAGHVVITGRVGTEQELQQIEQVVTDVLGIADLQNDLVIDELVRGETSEDVVEAQAEDEEVDDQLGEPTGEEDYVSDSSDHLVEDLEGDAYGTHDMQDAIEKGQSYSPPDRPVQMGSRSQEDH